ncbi:KAP family P-loop NTPase fold protein [Priestia megaterium]|uniref:KAP family P-loop NTPase fold protein n=1 Tax=Priestia megaterium TaxID=1404 RepID=UPI003D039565
MFLGDSPIIDEREDLLDRKNFSKHLGQAICDWKENESLVIALNGEWGIGKSSIINMAVAEIQNSIREEKPTIVNFNPWIYSDLSNLTSNFFDELSKELKIQNGTLKDKQIAEKLKIYSDLLNIVPDKKTLKSNYDKLLVGVGLSGISLSTISSWIGIGIGTMNHILLGLGIVIIFKEMVQGALSRGSKFFESKSKVNEVTAIDIKQQIFKELSTRSNKLLIIIDDIDRLTHGEIKEIFRLIKINADFPNTIYLLSFDKGVVEKNLDVALGIPSSTYMEKIVQVSFDVPEVQTGHIYKYFFDQLDRIISRLPKSTEKFFSEESTYWPNIFHSGVKYFLKNLRNVKRFLSSLEFTIFQMHKNDVLEVNPIDFIAIEALRVFVPDFYNFIRQNKELFISTRDDELSNKNNKRQEKLMEGIANSTGEHGEHITNMLKYLFPQLENVIERGSSSYGAEWTTRWSSMLRVCSPIHFDSYFVYLPKGSSDKISQYELEMILKTVNERKTFELSLHDYIQKGKIRNLLELFQDYTNDINKFPTNCFQNVIVPLLNLIKSLPQEEEGKAYLSTDMEVMRVIYQLLKRENNQDNNFALLHEAIVDSKSLYGVVRMISLQTPRENDINETTLLKENHLLALQELCVIKIKDSANTNTLLNNKNLLYILYRWKEWDTLTSDDLTVFIDRVTSNSQSLLHFLEAFRSVGTTRNLSDYASTKRIYFGFEELKDFVNDIEMIKTTLIQIKEHNPLQYKEHQEIIDLFLTGYGKNNGFKPY